MLTSQVPIHQVIKRQVTHFFIKKKVNSGFLLGHYLLTPNVCFQFRMVDGQNVTGLRAQTAL